MTDADWRRTLDPAPLLRYLGEPPPRRLPLRQARLFAVACCRRIWHLLTDRRSRLAVQAAERHATELATDEELAAAQRAALVIIETRPRYPAAALAAASAAARVSQDGACQLAESTAANAAIAVADTAADLGHASVLRRAERAAQAHLVRDLFRNPSRPRSLPPEVLAWNGGALVRMARAIADEQRFDELGVLGDALEEAGCTDAEVLGHCRGPHPHFRGCWVVELMGGTP